MTADAAAQSDYADARMTLRPAWRRAEEFYDIE